MEQPLKKHRKQTRRRRALSLALLAAVLLGGIIFLIVASKKASEVPRVEAPITYRTLVKHATEKVARIAVTSKGQAGYVLVGEEGRLQVEGMPDFVMDPDMEKLLLEAAAILNVEDTVAKTREEWEPHKADFGLDSPSVSVEVEYADGLKAAFSLGDKAPGTSLYYFTLEGDPGLYLASADIADLFTMDLMAFYKVDQPVIHRQRIDRITVADAAGNPLMAWALETGVESVDALSSWRMTSPYWYPCDAAAMESMLYGLEKLYLGRFVTAATEEEKARYGLVTPSRVITLHQAPAEMVSIGVSGANETASHPESTIVISVGASQGSFVNYCQVDEKIYLVSNVSQPLLSSFDPLSTLSRQPFAIPLEAIVSLTVEKGGQQREYTLRRQERLLPNNEFAKDEQGNVLKDTFVMVNGADTELAPFEEAVAALQSVTVLGRLPDGYTAMGSPSFRLEITMEDGRARTLECMPFDAFADALGIDGTYLYSIEKGALDKGL